MTIRTRLLSDASDFVQHWDEIMALRESVGAASDVLLNPIHFLTSTDETRRSCSVSCWRGEKLIGVVFATEHHVHRMGSGYAVGGDFTGRGLLLCKPEDETLVLKQGIRQMTAAGIHSLHLRFLPKDGSRITLKGLKMKYLDAVIPGDRIQFKATFEEFLSGLGKHTRRNVRAYTRKTEEEGIEFIPSVTAQQYEAAIARLNPKSDFPAEALHLERDERLLALYGGGDRMGLRSREGVLVAVLCGFRKNGRFHLLTQVNDSQYHRLSLSLVLRSYMMKYLIETGCSDLQFMGGSSLSFGRFCEPQSYRSLFIDKKTGMAVAAKLLCSRIAALLTRLKRPIPESLALICNGHLGESELSMRTALRPAAMLGEQHRAS